MASWGRRLSSSRLWIAIFFVGMGIVVTYQKPIAVTDPETPALQTRKEGQMDYTLADLQKLVQATIDLEPLQSYYHVDKAPGRKPLVVLKNTIIEKDLGLSKFGVPVLFLSRAETEGKPYLEFTQLTRTGDNVVIEFQYPVEGILGTVHFKKSGETWQVKSSDIVEQ